MTPSTSLTLGGFLQGLQAQTMGLIATIILILVARWVILSFVSKTQSVGGASAEDTGPVRSFVNWGAGIVLVLTLVGFGWSAANYATNVIPHTDLDKSGVYQDMNSNIQKR